MNRLHLEIVPDARKDRARDSEGAGQCAADDDQIRSRLDNAARSDTVPASSSILFIDEVAALLRVSRSTIERRRRDGTFPIAELRGLDSRPRWSRQAVERFLTSSTGGLPRTRRASRRSIASCPRRSTNG